MNDYFGGMQPDDRIVAERAEENSISSDGGKTVIKYRDRVSFFRLIYQAVKCKKTEYREGGEFVKGLIYMLDCSRNAVINLKSVKRLAAVLAVTGYTGLSLYCEDTYEVEDEPCFGSKRGRYSVAELREIKEICDALGLELILSVQGLTHMRSIARWEPYYNGTIDCNDVLLVNADRTYELIDHMFRTLAINLKGCRVNIGFDEPFMLGRGKYLNKNGYTDPEELFLIHLEKVVRIARKYELKPMMWGEFWVNFKNKQEIYDRVIEPYGVQTINWGYGAFDYFKKTKQENYNGFRKIIEPLADKCYSYACSDWRFLGIAPHTRFAVMLADAAMDAAIDCGQKEVWLTAWGDTGAEVSPFATLPSILCYGYKRLFGKDNALSFEAFFRDFFGEVEDHYALDGANALDENSINSASKTYLYNDLFLGFADKTVKGDYGAIYRTYLKKLREIRPVHDLQYVFDTQIALLEVLTIKYNLGNELRAAYEKHDIAELKRIAEEVIPLLSEKCENFFAAFKKQFLYDNKPFGFEIHTSRIGALIFRLKDCRERLLAYIQGAEDCIPELEEPTPDNLGDGKECLFLNWGELTSAGVAVEYFSFVQGD